MQQRMWQSTSRLRRREWWPGSWSWPPPRVRLGRGRLEREPLGLRRQRRADQRLGAAVHAGCARVHTDIIAGEAGLAVEQDGALPDRRKGDAGAAGDDLVATSEHAVAETLPPVEHRTGADPLLGQLLACDERGVAVVGRLVRDAERPGGETPEHRAAEVDQHDTPSPVDGQRSARRLTRPRAGPSDTEADEAQDKDELPHGSDQVSVPGV